MAPELLNLSAPQVTPAVTTSTFKIAYIGLGVEHPGVLVRLRGQHGEIEEIKTDTDAEAITLLRALNKANLSVKSLERRCLEWCATKRPALAGAITGTPD